MNASIFYYTNNLLPPLLFSSTLNDTIDHCKSNDCELIITSHFPVSKVYDDIEIYLSPDNEYRKIFDPSSNSHKIHPIYDYLVKNISIDTSQISCKNYVTGKLPYSLESIIRQLLFSVDQSKSDNIILMEHDCFYPHDYVKTAINCLNNGRDLTYCSFSHCFLNRDGFFKLANPRFYLSGCCFKKSVFKKVFSKKLTLIEKNKPYRFEPILSVEEEFKKNQYKGEIIVNNSLCIDTLLHGGNILDIKHGLNQNGQISFDTYFLYHNYWKDAQKYIDMIKDSPCDKCNYGVSVF